MHYPHPAPHDADHQQPLPADDGDVTSTTPGRLRTALPADSILRALPGNPTGSPWQQLLRERALSGVLLTDCLDHGYNLIAEQIYRVHVQPQEAQLRASRAWTTLVEEQLQAVEDARHHQPGQGLALTQPWPCLVCIKEDPSLALAPATRTLPLPRDGRTWQHVQPLPPHRHTSHGYGHCDEPGTQSQPVLSATALPHPRQTGEGA